MIGSTKEEGGIAEPLADEESGAGSYSAKVAVLDNLVVAYTFEAGIIFHSERSSSMHRAVPKIQIFEYSDLPSRGCPEVVHTSTLALSMRKLFSFSVCSHFSSQPSEQELPPKTQYAPTSIIYTHPLSLRKLET